MKGINKRGNRYRLRKFNTHIGFYSTYEEAVKAGGEEEKKQEVFRHMQQYLKSKTWLIENGVLPKTHSHS